VCLLYLRACKTDHVRKFGTDHGLGGADGGPGEDAEASTRPWASKVRDALFPVSFVVVVVCARGGVLSYAVYVA